MHPNLENYPKYNAYCALWVVYYQKIQPILTPNPTLNPKPYPKPPREALRT